MKSHPWLWVPTAFFAEGGPYTAVSAVSAVVFKSLGMSNTQLALWTSLMMMPWSIKPLWSPLLDAIGTKRRWILAMQLTMTALFVGAAALLLFEQLTLALIAAFFLLAFASATHDVAVDGFYLLALSERDQAFFIGIRSTFYRIATISVQGGLVVMAGAIHTHGFGTLRQGWAAAFVLTALVMAALALWHSATLPKTEAAPTSEKRDFLREFFRSFWAFCRLPNALWLIAFLLFFRIAEAQLGKMAQAFLLDPAEVGGLGLSVEHCGFLYGTTGALALVIGGILGGMAISRWGFRRCLWPMVAAINVPDLVYVYLAECRPDSLALIGSCIAVEQFGYGVGFTAMVMVMVDAAKNSGEYKTSHFAIMTGLSILMLSLFGMLSGWIETMIGYRWFFWYVTICTIPSFLVAIPIYLHLKRERG